MRDARRCCSRGSEIDGDVCEALGAVEAMVTWGGGGAIILHGRRARGGAGCPGRRIY